MRQVEVGKYEKEGTDCKVRDLKYLVRREANGNEKSTIHSEWCIPVVMDHCFGLACLISQH